MTTNMFVVLWLGLITVFVMSLVDGYIKYRDNTLYTLPGVMNMVSIFVALNFMHKLFHSTNNV